jgi:hydroxymethylpyrimidine kinase/phosphomethylpyrimidine kinase
MLPTREIIDEIARIAAERDLGRFVVDPVVRSTSGFDLIDDAALRSLIGSLFPLADVITPNLPEAERIARMTIRSDGDIRAAGRVMLDQGAKSVLIKGGHGFGPEAAGGTARDFFFDGSGEQVFEAEYIDTTSTHGTGCTLSAAIAAGLAKGKALESAIGEAKEYVTRAIRTAPGLGRGHSPVNH